MIGKAEKVIVIVMVEDPLMKLVNNLPCLEAINYIKQKILDIALP